MPIVPRPNANAPPDEQLQFRFAIEQAPHRVRSCGLVETHFFPKVSLGSPWWYTRRVPVRTAWRRWPEIQLDSATAHVAVILDVDHDIQTCLNVALGPLVRLPTWICTSPRGHSHVVYLLSRPVLRTEDARKRPLVLLARIAEYYTGVYCADTGYAAELTHNPCHPRYADDTTWWAERAWSLPELAEAIPRGWRIPARPVTIEGRNCALFRAAMRHFGQPSQWEASTDPGVVHAWIVDAFNKFFPPPQPNWNPKECWWIGASVSRICTKNLRSGQTQSQFLALQAERGRRSGKARRRGTPLELNRTPWLNLEISRPTWYRHEGLPEPTLSDLRPWELTGISRRTWYRWRQAGRL